MIPKTLFRALILSFLLLPNVTEAKGVRKNWDKTDRFLNRLKRDPRLVLRLKTIDIPDDYPARDAAALILGETFASTIPKKAMKWFRIAMSSDLSAVRIRAIFGLADLLMAKGDLKGVERLVSRLQKGRLPTNQRAHLLYLQAKIRHDKGMMRRVFIDYPTSKWANKTGIKEGVLTREELFQRAEGFSAVLDHREAARIYGRLHNKGYRPVETAWRLARIYLFKLRSHPKQAFKLLKQVEKQRGRGRKWLIATAKAYKMMEDYEHAEQLYHEYARRFPRDRFRVKCYYYFGWLPYDHGDYRRAIKEFDRFLRRFHHTSLRTYILWFKAWSQIKLRDYKGAIKTLKRMIPYGNNLVAGKAMYWLGVINHRIGDTAASRDWFHTLIDKYPMTYYSVLAWKRLKEWNHERGPAWVSSPDRVRLETNWGLDRLDGYKRLIIQRVKSLVALGFRNEAWRVYRHHRKGIERRFHGRDAVTFLTTLYGAMGRWHKLTKVGARRFRRYFGPVPTAKTSIYWSLLYPRAEYKYVVKFARNEGIDPLWVYSIMRQESRFRLSKVSVADAIGIMQMIPETAKRVARELGTVYDPFTFFLPQINIRFCVHYLASLFKDFKGQILFASAAYNGGAPPIRRMMLANKGRALDEMVENISYNQSRNYCRKVSEHLLRYMRIYATPKRRKRLLNAIYPDPVDYNLGSKVDY